MTGDIANSRESLNPILTETNMSELIPYIGGIITGIGLTAIWAWMINREDDEPTIEERVKAIEDKLK